MGFSRIKAVHIEDSVELENVLVFDMFVKDDNSVREMEVFGYAIDNNIKCPFYIKPKEKEGLLYWGANQNKANTTVNIYKKNINIGEYITRIEIYNRVITRYTYRVTELYDWNQLRQPTYQVQKPALYH